VVREQQVRVLVTVKAYPQPSRGYGETVCVAGVRVDREPEWIRLYPVTYRELEAADRFKKYQMVDLRVFPSSDTRPESFKPNLESVQIGQEIDSDNGTWRRRWTYLESLAGATTTCELQALQAESPSPSLGLIKPDVQDLVVEENDAFTADQQAIVELAASGDLFSEGRPVLQPAPYRVKYRYRCESEGCSGHEQSIIDWEVGEAGRSWQQLYPKSELPARLRSRFLDEMCGPDRDTYFFVGNQHRRPRGFMVLGVFWPLLGNRPQPSLFDVH
jgi:hypothetical protein